MRGNPAPIYYSAMTNPVLRGSANPVVGRREPRELERLRIMARLLDTAVQIPGTGFRFGLDAVIGLVPGIGDAIGAILSAYIIYRAARLGAPNPTLARMLGNVALDTIVGEIPLLGDLFDAGWKSNIRNVKLLEQHLEQPAAAKAGSRRVLLLLAGGLLILLVAVVAVGVLVANFVWELVK
jgi:uncharacterized protein DUF4112